MISETIMPPYLKHLCLRPFLINNTRLVTIGKRIIIKFLEHSRGLMHINCPRYNGPSNRIDTIVVRIQYIDTPVLRLEKKGTFGFEHFFLIERMFARVLRKVAPISLLKLSLNAVKLQCGSMHGFV